MVRAFEKKLRREMRPESGELKDGFDDDFVSDEPGEARIGAREKTEARPVEKKNEKKEAGDFYKKYHFLKFKLYFHVLGRLGIYLGSRRKIKKNRKIRVLRMVSVLSQGGVAKVCLQSLAPMPKEDVETTLLVFSERYRPEEFLAKHEEIQYVNRKLELWPASYKPKLFRSMFRLAKLIRSLDPDIIHVHEPQFAPSAAIASGLAGGRRIVVHLHNDYTRRKSSMDPPNEKLAKKTLRKVNLIACSQHILRCGRAWLRKTRFPIALIQDGNDDRLDAAPDEVLAVGLRRASGQRLVIAKMANLKPHKRIDDFLTACRILLDEGRSIFVLLICYGKEGAGRKTRLQFDHYFQPEEGEFLFCVRDPQHLLNQVDIGVSASELEGLGLNILEFQSGGAAVVCSDLDPHKEMVTDGRTGLLYPVTDVPALLRRLKKLVDDEELRRRLGAAGRLASQERKWSDTARNTVSLYKKILEA